MRNQYDVSGFMQIQQAVMPSGISQTPRLKATKMGSPILAGFDQQPMKRAISVLDQEYDIMGLSKNNALDDDDSILLGI